MRPQIVPIILCFFIAFAVNVPATGNTTYTVASFFKSTDNKAFNTDINSLSDLTDTKNISKLDRSKKKLLGKKNKTVLNVGKNSVKINNKEFSYKTRSITNASIDKLNLYTLTASQDTLFNLGMYYGFALTMVFLNIVCYLLFDEKIFFYNSLVLASLASLFFYSDGLLALFGVDGFTLVAALETTLLFITIGLSALFASTYLKISEFYPNLYKIILPLLLAASILVILAWSTGSDSYSNIANTLLFSILCVYFVAGVLLFSRKNYVKFYVIANGIPLLFAIDFFVLRGYGIDFLFTESVHLKVAVLAEMLIITYAIIFRMKAIKEENELRNTEMRIFLKRQDSMSRQNVELMVEDVYLENLIMHYDLDGLEIKLLQYISEGKTNEKIARKLKLSEAELEEQTKFLYEKLEISEQIQEDYRMVENQPDYLYN